MPAFFLPGFSGVYGNLFVKTILSFKKEKETITDILQAPYLVNNLIPISLLSEWGAQM